MKDNFLLKSSLIDVIKELSDEDTGKLFKGILNYVNYGDSKLTNYLKVIFVPIKNEIDKNEEKYESICERNRLNGKKGGRPKKEEKPTGLFGNPKKHDNNHIHNQYHIHNQIIEYLNNKLNSKYKSNSKSTISKINARLNEGYKLDDFIAVIDKKYAEWNGTEFEQYLCPETLFGTKFEKYLNQKISSGKKVSTTEWLGKDVESEQATKEEIEELEKRMKR